MKMSFNFRVFSGLFSRRYDDVFNSLFLLGDCALCVLLPTPLLRISARHWSSIQVCKLHFPFPVTSADTNVYYLHRSSLAACGGCQRPLPRCAICFLHLGSVPNPNQVYFVDRGVRLVICKSDFVLSLCFTY